MVRCQLGGPERHLLALALCTAGYTWALGLTTTYEERLHLLEYGVVALMLERAVSIQQWRHPRWLRLPALALAVAAVGWLDEGIQAALPNRQYDPWDVGFNALALLLLTACRAQMGNAPPANAAQPQAQ